MPIQDPLRVGVRLTGLLDLVNGERSEGVGRVASLFFQSVKLKDTWLSRLTKETDVLPPRTTPKSRRLVPTLG